MPKKSTVPMVRLEVSIPLELKLKHELFLKRDSFTGKIAFGEWSRLITTLLQQCKLGDSNE